MSSIIPVHDRDHVIGPPSAAITVINYGDYECPGCHSRHREVEKMIEQLANSVRFVYRHFPLVQVHPHALRAAEAAEVAGAQNKFWEMHRHLYLNPDKLADNNLRKYAREIGLDLARFDAEMANGTYSEQILKDRDLSVIHGVTGTPTTFINDVLYAESGEDLIKEVRTMMQSDHQSHS